MTSKPLQADKARFELAEAFTSHAFEACSLDRSDTYPCCQNGNLFIMPHSADLANRSFAELDSAWDNAILCEIAMGQTMSRLTVRIGQLRKSEFFNCENPNSSTTKIRILVVVEAVTGPLCIEWSLPRSALRLTARTQLRTAFQLPFYLLTVVRLRLKTPPAFSSRLSSSEGAWNFIYATCSWTEALTHWDCWTLYPEKMPMSSMQSR